MHGYTYSKGIINIIFTKRLIANNSQNISSIRRRGQRTTLICDNIITIKYYDHRFQLMAKHYHERYGTKVNFTPTTG